jgi:hypothetical protein
MSVCADPSPPRKIAHPTVPSCCSAVSRRRLRIEPARDALAGLPEHQAARVQLIAPTISKREHVSHFLRAVLKPDPSGQASLRKLHARYDDWASDQRSPSEKAKSTEGNPTSTRSPGNQATTPNSQVDTTKSGEISDRTPKNHSDGAAAGEQGKGMSGSSGSASNQGGDQTYQSDKAQEQQLKGSGTSDKSR